LGCRLGLGSGYGSDSSDEQRQAQK
jgi:hypothetical protein